MKPEQQAKKLFIDHLYIISDSSSEVFDKGLEDEFGLVNSAKSHAIVSANLVREQFLLAPQIEYWNRVIQAIKNYQHV
jgi:hypothetical protein